MVAGRDFTARDLDGAPGVAIVNETLARNIFPGKNPIGSELVLLTSSATWMRRGPVQIVGVVANIKEVGINEVDFNSLYLPLAQSPPSSFQLIATTAVAPASVVTPLRAELLAAGPDLPGHDRHDDGSASSTMRSARTGSTCC